MAGSVPNLDHADDIEPFYSDIDWKLDSFFMWKYLYAKLSKCSFKGDNY